MCRLRHFAKLFAFGTLAVLLAGRALAQVRQEAPSEVQQDVFASVHETLSEAADRALAAGLANAEWVKASDPSAVIGRRRSEAQANSSAQVHAAIERVNRLRPAIEPILGEEGVPAELSAVVLVESGGLTALSPKGARGIWQLMPETARRYGLMVSTDRDERLDTTRSTQAAARYLRDLYSQFGDWQLTFAAYNAGAEAVRRAISRTGKRDFLAIERALPAETRKYVPAIFAAMQVLGSNPQGMGEAVRAKTQVNGRVLYASAEENEE